MPKREFETKGIGKFKCDCGSYLFYVGANSPNLQCVDCDENFHFEDAPNIVADRDGKQKESPGEELTAQPRAFPTSTVETMESEPS